MAFSSSLTMRRLSPFSFFASRMASSSCCSCSLDEAVEELVGDRQEFERAVRDDDGVVVAAGDAGHRALAVAGREMLLAGDEEPGLRIEFQEFRAPLLDQMVGHDEHGLLGQPQAAHFHRGGRHRPGLSRADDVGQQRAAALQDAPDRVFLVRGQVAVAQVLARPCRERSDASRRRCAGADC